MQLVGLGLGLDLKPNVQEHRSQSLPDAGLSRGLHCMSDLLAVKVQPGVGREDLVLMAGRPSQTLRRRPTPVKLRGYHLLQHIDIRCIAFHGVAFVRRRHLTPDVGHAAPQSRDSMLRIGAVHYR